MTLDKSAFIEFLLECNVLQFGEFTLNSGRRSPYFFNLGNVSDGAAYAQLGRAYAQTIIDSGVEFDVLFGPAYKGIPIAVATAVALAEQGRCVGVAYNRKEAKDHGEGGLLVGAPVSGRVLLVDDVLTSGKALRAAVTLIQQAGATIAGAVIAMDREEVLARDDVEAAEHRTAVSVLADELAAPVVSIANLRDLIEFLEQSGQQGAEPTLERMRDYQTRFCLVH